MSNTNAPKLRPNVAAIVQNMEGSILICERMSPEGAWQFPQGGIKRGESAEQALAREMSEEIGLASEDYIILEKRGPYSYLFEKKSKGFSGQEQLYFLVKLVNPDAVINVETEHKEFRAARWIKPEEFEINWLPDFKKEVYKSVFYDFFDLKR